MFGYIYETMNLINGMKYIGKHKSSKFDKNYKGSGVKLKKAFEEFGKENFSVRIIEEIPDFDNNEEGLRYLSERETNWINICNAVMSNKYYNNSYGSEKEGWSGVNKAIKDNPNYYKEHHWKYTGTYNPKNRKYSKENIEKFKKNHWKNLGLSVWNKGIKIPKEKLTDHQKNFGPICKNRIWVNKNNINKRIKSEELEVYLYQGWNKGRILSEKHKLNMKGHIPWNKKSS